MVGMIQIMTYLLCIYLVYKGFEIFQIALMSNREKREPGLTIGVFAIIISFIVAIIFIFWINAQARAISGTMPRWP